MKICTSIVTSLLLFFSTHVYASQGTVKKLAVKRPAPETVAAIEQETQAEQNLSGPKKIRPSELGAIESLDEEEMKEQAAQAPGVYKLVLPNGQSLEFDAKLLQQSTLLTGEINFLAASGRKNVREIPVTQYITKLNNAGEQVSLRDLHDILSVLAEHVDNQSEALEKLLQNASLTFPRLIHLVYIANYFGIEPLFQWTIQTLGKRFAERSYVAYKKAIAQLPEEWQIAITPGAIAHDRLIMNFLGSYPLVMHSYVGGLVAWSPDGNQLASAGANAPIKIWDTATGALVRTLEEDTVWVTSIAFSPDGKQLACGNNRLSTGNNHITIWNATTGTLVRTLEVGISEIYSVAWSPDSMHLVSGIGWLGTGHLTIWDTITGALVRMHEDLTGNIISLRWSPEGTRFISGSNGFIKIWDASTGALVRTLKIDGGRLRALSPDGSQAAFFFPGGVIKIWDVATGALVRTLQKLKNADYSVAWSPDGRYLGLGVNETIKIWDMTTEFECTFKAKETFRSIAWSPDSRRFAASHNNLIEIWDVSLAWLGLTIAQMDLLKKMIQEKRDIALPAEVVTYAHLPDGWKALLTKAFGQEQAH